MITFKELLKRAKSNDITVHTPTEDQAKILLSELDKKGYKWASGNKLTTTTDYGYDEENTCYSLELDNRICHGSFAWYQEHDYTIIEFKDIDFKVQSLVIVDFMSI